MASAPLEPRTVTGRVDKAGRLTAADPALETLQRQAGSVLGQRLALPQVIEIAELARALGTVVSRPAIAASSEHDLDLWVTATPAGDDVLLEVGGWNARPPSAPRLASLLGEGGEAVDPVTALQWIADEQLRLISVSPALAELIRVDLTEAVGAPLTRLFRLEENDEGEMPLIAGLATRRPFSGQRARTRVEDAPALTLSGEVIEGANGRFAGFRGTAAPEEQPGEGGAAAPASLQDGLSDLLRSPIDRIIDSAEQIGADEEAPLGEAYAGYGNDIAAAARHLMSVLHRMNDVPLQDHGSLDLAALSAEAVVMLDSAAEQRGVRLQLEVNEPLAVTGDERAIIQIVVNLISNAIRHSPDNGLVRISFARHADSGSVTVQDEGLGITAGDEDRIFERFERAQGAKVGTGLGLAIARRLARSMGGDVTLDSRPGEGARFTLTLPAA